MISSAIMIWDKSARVNFSKTNKIARARRASAICSLYDCGFIPNCTRKSCDYLLIIHIQNFALRVDVKLADVFEPYLPFLVETLGSFRGL